MLLQYKLRLRDGTVLAVYHDGLMTWMLDDRAMVQPAGSRRWRPLKELLAEERAAARQAARQRPAPAEVPPQAVTPSLPLVPPPPPPVAAPLRPAALAATSPALMVAAEESEESLP